MIIAEVGARPKVNGKSIAVVLSGEMPGSTPTSVPIRTPNRQKRRFCTESAVEKPRARLLKRSTKRSLPPRPDGERQTEAVDEQKDREGRDDDGENDALPPAEIGGGKRRTGHGGQCRQGQSAARQEQGEGG